MPGASFTHESRVQQRLDERPGRRPRRRRRSCVPRAVRRAGSAYATSKGVVSTVVASATVTAPPRPSASRLAAATSTRTGSRSTPATGEPGPGEGDQVAADAAAEVDQRSRRSAARARAARCVATRQPGGLLEPVGGEVHPVGEVAELRLGPPAQLDLGQGGGHVLRRSPYDAARPAPAAGRRGRGASVAVASSRCPASVSSQRKASRSTRPSSQPAGRTPDLALVRSEC